MKGVGLVSKLAGNLAGNQPRTPRSPKHTRYAHNIGNDIPIGILAKPKLLPYVVLRVRVPLTVTTVIK